MVELERATAGEGKQILQCKGGLVARCRREEGRGKKEGEKKKRGCGPARGTVPKTKGNVAHVPRYLWYFNFFFFFLASFI